MMALNVIKISPVRPATPSLSPVILPLTFFDLLWLHLVPTNRVIFYKLTESSSSCDSFHSAILPKLERSLSLVLAHFLPLSGHLNWDPQAPKPHILISPHDAVSLTVAETDADFSQNSTKGIRPRKELRALVPELPVSSYSSPVMTLQITLFPSQGFCMGLSLHHAVADGKTVVKFLKSWAHICKHGAAPRDFDLPMVLDRTVVNVPAELEAKISRDKASVARSVSLHPAAEETDDLVKLTLELSHEDVEKLRERVRRESTRPDLPHLSTFVVTYAYVLACVVKARGGEEEEDRLVPFMYVADFRQRLHPPVPVNYFGNCVLPINFYRYKATTFSGKDGFVNGVEILGDSIRGLSSRGAEESLWEMYEEGLKWAEPGTPKVIVAGSNRFGIYGSDFGWGRPVNTENISLTRNILFTMSERRDEIGGVEIGMCLKRCETDVFVSLFRNGL
ncbi:BAHD acyltransferase At3g29680-like [Brassica napus]|uniref:BAHD acyltransferase n=2 Tax=Brassica TaxID=3705 RepID=A0A0D3BJC5_BRAOL|nr:PREDICTED: BAHD acyltransferase At3g29680-like [Brassica oleracea var. oleracea]XP_048606282.1 BAHD acyltransferase At3g29680-like [Brassica napus]KAG2291078.1 hypothetical protein Bca52824_037747 [Brassica carinata]